MQSPPTADEQQQRAVAAIRKHGFWFVDIPRTSSTSIKVELGRRFGPAYGKANVVELRYATEQYLPDHMLARDVRDLLGQTAWDDVYSFTIVRNPWERVLSLFHYRRTRSKIPDEWTFSEFVRRLVDATEDTKYFKFHALRRGAADFVLDADGTVLVDSVVRFEDRVAGLRQVARQLHLPELGRISVQGTAASGRDYREEYDDESRDLVAQRFAKDVVLFDYSF